MSNSSWLRVLAWITVVALAGALYAAFLVAPTERTMGNVQRIFYFHVGSAWTAAVAFLLNAIGCIAFLAGRRQHWDAFAVAAAEAGLVFCTGVLLTGPLWAKPVWGIWWTWDARLTSTLVCWLLYMAYLMLRHFVPDSERRAIIASVFGIFAFADVPIVYMSIRWWRTQHPQPVIAGGEGSGLNPTMWTVLLTALGALLCLMVCYLMLRIPIEMAGRRSEFLRRRLRLEDAL